jgi:hypothetical protein
MIWIHGKIMHFNTHLLRGFMDDLFQTVFDSAYKYGSAPFRTPYEMVVDEIDLSSCMLIAHILTTIPSSSEELNPPTARLLHV